MGTTDPRPPADDLDAPSPWRYAGAPARGGLASGEQASGELGHGELGHGHQGHGVPAQPAQAPEGPEPWRALPAGGPAGAPRGVVPALWGLVAALAVLALAVAGLAAVVGVSAAAVLADDDPLASWESSADDAGGLEPGDDYGDSTTLDSLWDACADEDWAACDELFQISDVGSGYEDFGGSCGDLRPGQEPGTCEESLG